MLSKKSRTTPLGSTIDALRGFFVLVTFGVEHPRVVCDANGVRIPRLKIDKLACQAQSAGIFAKGETPRFL